jgi:hypothetical protein
VLLLRRLPSRNAVHGRLLSRTPGRTLLLERGVLFGFVRGNMCLRSPRNAVLGGHGLLRGHMRSGRRVLVPRHGYGLPNGRRLLLGDVQRHLRMRATGNALHDRFGLLQRHMRSRWNVLLPRRRELPGERGLLLVRVLPGFPPVGQLHGAWLLLLRDTGHILPKQRRLLWCLLVRGKHVPMRLGGRSSCQSFSTVRRTDALVARRERASTRCHVRER